MLLAMPVSHCVKSVHQAPPYWSAIRAAKLQTYLMLSFSNTSYVWLSRLSCRHKEVANIGLHQIYNRAHNKNTYAPPSPHTYSTFRVHNLPFWLKGIKGWRTSMHIDKHNPLMLCFALACTTH